MTDQKAQYNGLRKRYVRYADEDELEANRAAYLAEQENLLTDPRPLKVSLAHFITRDLRTRIAAGECRVLLPNPMFTGSAPYTVLDVTPEPGGRYIIHLDSVIRPTWTLSSATLSIIWKGGQHASQTPK